MKKMLSALLTLCFSFSAYAGPLADQFKKEQIELVEVTVAEYVTSLKASRLSKLLIDDFEVISGDPLEFIIKKTSGEVCKVVNAQKGNRIPSSAVALEVQCPGEYGRVYVRIQGETRFQEFIYYED